MKNWINGNGSWFASEVLYSASSLHLNLAGPFQSEASGGMQRSALRTSAAIMTTFVPSSCLLHIDLGIVLDIEVTF